MDMEVHDCLCRGLTIGLNHVQPVWSHRSTDRFGDTNAPPPKFSGRLGIETPYVGDMGAGY
jgi:hypothetical protein